MPELLATAAAEAVVVRTTKIAKLQNVVRRLVKFIVCTSSVAQKMKFS